MRGYNSEDHHRHRRAAWHRKHISPVDASLFEKFPLNARNLGNFSDNFSFRIVGIVCHPIFI